MMKTHAEEPQWVYIVAIEACGEQIRNSAGYDIRETIGLYSSKQKAESVKLEWDKKLGNAYRAVSSTGSATIFLPITDYICHTKHIQWRNIAATSHKQLILVARLFVVGCRYLVLQAVSR